MVLLSSCHNPSEPLMSEIVLWSSSFETQGQPSLDTWQVSDSSTAAAISFSPDVASLSGGWSLFVPLDSTRMHSLRQDIPIPHSSPNDLYILTYRAKCIGQAGALAGFAILLGDTISYCEYNFVVGSNWTSYCDTIIPPAKAASAHVGIMVHKDFSHLTVPDLFHPVHYDTNAVLFDDFQLVQHRE